MRPRTNPTPPSRRARDIQGNRQHFLWGGRIPVHHLSVIAGGPSIGKSTLGYRIFADVDLPTIFVTTEEVHNTIWRPRLEACGGDLDKAYHHPEILFSRDRREQDKLANLVKEYGAKLVFVDPASNHLRDGSIYKDNEVRRTLYPYMQMMSDLDFSIVFQVHVLRSVPKNAHPLQAIPAGIVSIAKAVYIFGEDPRVGADPNLRILACADKFNFGRRPASVLFEYESHNVKVMDTKTKKWVHDEFGVLTSRGEVKIGARAILVTLRPEDKERKSDRVALILIDQLRKGPKLVSEIRAVINDTDPPVAWRTVERVAKEMQLEVMSDFTDARKKLWALPQETLDILAEAAEDGSDIEIREVP